MRFLKAGSLLTTGTMSLPTAVKELIGCLGLIPHPEGGFFVETFRSGCEPMSTRGQSGYECKPKDLVETGRRHRPDKDGRRNCLTSIYWVPTLRSPRLLLAYNDSDHVHYFQGGRPFRYTLFDPVTKEYHQEILGPDIKSGHKMQVCVRGGVWKCGAIIHEELDAHGDGPTGNFEYCLIGEAVAPGFDFHDFNWVTAKLLNETVKDKEQVKYLAQFVHEQATEIEEENKTVDEAQAFYEENEVKDRRVDERS